MSARPLTAPPLNRLGIALLIAALVCWIGFHLLPMEDHTRGWETWQSIWMIMTRGSMPGWHSMVFISSFLTLSILVMASPFATSLLQASRLCRWLAIGGSGFALLCLGTIILDYGPLLPALTVLLASMTLNFAGLICLRAPHLETRPDAP